MAFARRAVPATLTLPPNAQCSNASIQRCLRLPDAIRAIRRTKTPSAVMDTFSAWSRFAVPRITTAVLRRALANLFVWPDELAIMATRLVNSFGRRRWTMGRCASYWAPMPVHRPTPHLSPGYHSSPGSLLGAVSSSAGPARDRRAPAGAGRSLRRRRGCRRALERPLAA